MVHRQTGSVNFHSEAHVANDTLRFVGGQSETIQLPVWRSKEQGWDWSVKEHHRGLTAKLLTAAFAFSRLGERARSIEQPFIRLTAPLGRGEGFYSTLRSWNKSYDFKHAQHDCTVAGTQHMPASIRKKINEGSLDGDAFLRNCNTTIVCDATSLCPKICLSGSNTSTKAPHPTYPSVMVPQQCTNTPHGGSDGYCREHTVKVADRLPHSERAQNKTETVGAASRTRSLALRRKAMKATIARDFEETTFKPLTRKTASLAKELNDDELLETLTSGLDMNVEGGALGAEDMIELDKKNSIKHYGCVACSEFFLTPCGVCVGWAVQLHAESSSQVATQFLLKVAPKRDVKVLIEDNGCNLRRFFENRPELLASVNKTLGDGFEIVVDKFHFGSHDAAYCKEHCDPYKLPQVDLINTEACEQFFSWLGNIRRCVVGQDIELFEFMVTELVAVRNCYVELGML